MHYVIDLFIGTTIFIKKILFWIFQSAVVYQLQRRVRTLRDQLQRRDLHLDLLRKKLNICEQNHRVKSILEAEKEEANMRYLLKGTLSSSLSSQNKPIYHSPAL